MKRSGWIIGGVVAGVFLLLFMALGLAGLVALARLGGGGGGRWEERRVEGSGPSKIAIIHIDGQIHGGASSSSPFGGGGAGAEDVTSQIRQAIKQPDVRGVILRIDSPGGAVVASDEIARAVRRLRGDKPVVASMGDLAASGGYYVASHAQRIVANPGTVTGSIGVIAILPNLEGAASKLGIKPVVLKSGALKDVGSPFKEMSARERRVYQRLLDEAHEQFMSTVAEGRDMPMSTVRKLADGRPYSGLQAKANGLVDELGDLEDAYDEALDLADLTRGRTSLVEYRPRRGIGDLFPFGVSSPVDDVKRQFGVGLGLQYLYTP